MTAPRQVSEPARRLDAMRHSFNSVCARSARRFD